MTQRWIAFWSAVAAVLPWVASAETIVFTNRELQAVSVLAHPEQASVRLDGREGVLTPPPALRYFGVPVHRFEVDMRLIADLLDLRFQDLRAENPRIEFENGRLRLRVPVVDNSRAIRSSLGSVGFKQVTIVADLIWTRLANGSQRLSVGQVIFEGKLTGTGVLSGSLVLNQIKKLGVQSVEKQIAKTLAREEVQEKIRSGLIGWSRVSTGEDFDQIVPGSLAFYREGDVSGLRYAAE